MMPIVMESQDQAVAELRLLARSYTARLGLNRSVGQEQAASRHSAAMATHCIAGRALDVQG